MTNGADWRSRAGTLFQLRKREVVAARGMVAANHPLGSAAGVEMLLQGGNAVDAAVAALCALTVVEPMMVSIFGAGFVNLRLGRTGELVHIDNYAVAPEKARPDMFEPVEGGAYHDVVGRKNEVGHLAVGVPGAMRAWDELVKRYGRLPLSTVMEPAVRFAETGFRVSLYLQQWIEAARDDISRFPNTASVFLPGGRIPSVGDVIVRRDYAETLREIGRSGAEAMYTGEIARKVVADMELNGGLITLEDLAQYQLKFREPVRSTYRGYEIIGMAPASAGGIQIVQMLNLLEGFDVHSLGYGSPASIHLLAEVQKISLADRLAYLGDPDFVSVPVAMLRSKRYAAERCGEIDQRRAKRLGPARPHGYAKEPRGTTHVTVVDEEGTVISSTQTLHGYFGSRVTTPGTGMLLNCTMALFDPRPGRPNSIFPGKRMLSSMAPTVVLKEGRPVLALGTPGGRMIYAAVLQAIVNVIDHGMSIQEAVEAPRVWTDGETLQVEEGFPRGVIESLTAMGHQVREVSNVGMGMNGVLIDQETGILHGAACWRADGVPAGISGGPALSKKMLYF